MASPLLKVLVVDDEPLVGQLVASLVQRVGYNAEVVRSAGAALESIKSKDFSLIITDIQMPGKDGLTLCREVGRLYPDLPVMAMSGSGPIDQNEDLRQATKAGARSTVVKPFKLDEFYSAMTIALGTPKL